MNKLNEITMSNVSFVIFIVLIYNNQINDITR